MTGAEADLLAALLGAVRRLHFGAGDPAYRHQTCDVCHLVTRAELELAAPALLPPRSDVSRRGKAPTSERP